MDITIVLYENMTSLDAIGPYEVLVHGPGHRVRFAALEAGPVTVDSRVLQMHASHPLRAIERTDLLLVPGGPGSRVLETHDAFLAEIRRLHATTQYTTSVCTGSLILAAAGLLDGVPATTHWSQLERLAEFGAQPTSRRYVEHGKIITAAGVSAGIDMALHLLARLHSPDVAMAVQLGIEYDPEPPFDAGSPHKADPGLVQRMRARVAAA